MIFNPYASEEGGSWEVVQSYHAGTADPIQELNYKQQTPEELAQQVQDFVAKFAAGPKILAAEMDKMNMTNDIKIYCVC